MNGTLLDVANMDSLIRNELSGDVIKKFFCSDNTYRKNEILNKMKDLFNSNPYYYSLIYFSGYFYKFINCIHSFNFFIIIIFLFFLLGHCSKKSELFIEDE